MGSNAHVINPSITPHQRESLCVLWGLPYIILRKRPMPSMFRVLGIHLSQMLLAGDQILSHKDPDIQPDRQNVLFLEIGP